MKDEETLEKVLDEQWEWQELHDWEKPGGAHTTNH